MSEEKNISPDEVENVTEDIIEDTAENTAGETAAEAYEQADCEQTPEETVAEAVAEANQENKKSKKKKKDKKDEEIAELKERITRNLAEFDNFRKRTEREKAQMFDMGAKTMIEKLLPVIDNFERGLATLDEKALEEPFAAGIEKTYKQLQTVLAEVGVTAIEAVGKEFNPDIHNAVMHVEDDSFGENIVCEEFQKGYMYRDSVVRHSMVKVAN